MKKFWSDNWLGFAVVGIVTSIIGAIIGWPMYELHKRDQECAVAEQQCGLWIGTRVSSVLDNTPGMVTAYSCGNVWVRFSASANRTDTHILGSDGVIAREPYATVHMGCYEVSRDK